MMGCRPRAEEGSSSSGGRTSKSTSSKTRPSSASRLASAEGHRTVVLHLRSLLGSSEVRNQIGSGAGRCSGILGDTGHHLLVSI